MLFNLKNMFIMTTYDSIMYITIYLIVGHSVCSQMITVIYKASKKFFIQKSLAF